MLEEKIMNDIILLKLGEVVLKGLNRRSFEQKLMGNVRRRLLGLGEFKVSCMQSTIYVEPASDSADMDAAFEAMQDVFGIVKISRACVGSPSKAGWRLPSRGSCSWQLPPS